MSPFISYILLGASVCGYLSDYQHLSARPAVRSMFSRGAVRMAGAEMKKDTGNLSDYQCLSVYLGVKNSEKVEQKITDPNLLISLIILIFQNAVLRLVSVFDH